MVDTSESLESSEVQRRIRRIVTERSR